MTYPIKPLARQDVDLVSRMNGPRAPRISASMTAALALFVSLCLSSAAMADAIKLGNLWVENVTVDTYDGNELHYLVNGTPNKQFLTKIDGFKLAAYPQLEEAEKALAAGKSKEVLTLFKTVRGRAKEVWLRTWLDSRLVPLMDKEGEPVAAVNTFIALIDAKAPAAFLEDPPIKSARGLSKEEKAKVHEKLKTQRKAAKDKSPLADALDEMIEATEPGSEPAVVTPGNPNNPNPPVPGVDGESVVPLPSFMINDKPDAITKLIARGRFDQALSRVEEELKAAAGGGRTSLLLFQRGVSQYYLALEMEKDQSKKAQAKTLYEDAGLSLFRIPTFFKNSPYVGPALLETAAVHVRLNRPDVASRLLDQASPMIDPDDKALFGRLEKLREEIAR